MKVNNSGHELDDKQIERMEKRGRKEEIFTVLRGPSGHWYIESYHELTQRAEVELLNKLFIHGLIS